MSKKKEERKLKNLKKFEKFMVRFSSAVKKEIDVPYPKKKSEAEIQAGLWAKLRILGYDARMEVAHSENRKIISRFDIVLYKGKKAFCIIEVKATKITKIAVKNAKEQHRKYLKYKAELIYCLGEDDVKSTIEKVRRLF